MVVATSGQLSKTSASGTITSIHAIILQMSSPLSKKIANLQCFKLQRQFQKIARSNFTSSLRLARQLGIRLSSSVSTIRLSFGLKLAIHSGCGMRTGISIRTANGAILEEKQ